MHFIKTVVSNIFVMLYLSSIPAAMADTIKLKNGDVLTGKVVKKETDKLVLKTSYAGEVSITWSEINTIDTEKPIKLMLVDGSILTGQIQQTGPGSIKVINLQENTNTNLALNALAYINPSPVISGEGTVWKGQANLGGAITQGNAETTVLRFDAEAIARTKKNRGTVGGYFNRADNNNEDTVFNSKGYLQLDHFLSKQWYVYANGSLENDKFRDISLRSSAGVGSGYQFYESPERNFAIEAGINYIHTDFDLAEDENYASGRWALKYDQLIFQSVKFFHQHEILFSLEDVANTLVFTKTGLRVPIADNLNASTQLNIDYAGQPAKGRERLDKTLLFSLGYGW